MRHKWHKSCSSKKYCVSVILLNIYCINDAVTDLPNFFEFLRMFGKFRGSKPQGRVLSLWYLLFASTFRFLKVDWAQNLEIWPNINWSLKVIHGLTDNEVLKHERVKYAKNYSLCLQADLHVLHQNEHKELNSLRCYISVIRNALLVSSNIKSLLQFKQVSKNGNQLIYR